VIVQEKSLDVQVSGGPAIAWADTRRVRQILQNLVSNAVKFTPRGKVLVQVDLTGSGAVITVLDTGPGIPKEQQAAIFEEYWQAPASRQARVGAGLGLAITRRLVRMHGGRIELFSEPGQGAKFTVVLPTQPPQTATRRFISTMPPPPDMVIDNPSGTYGGTTR
jgi:signal transduction histidine kinase